MKKLLAMLLILALMLSLTPARLCGCDVRKGSIAPGKDADLVVMDRDFRVRQVYVKGTLRHQA